MNKPFYILSAKLQYPMYIPNFFSIQNNPIYDLLSNPPFLRKYGWNLITLDTPRIVKGECWEVRNADRKLIRLYKDGTIITRFAADGSFLGWGRHDHPEVKGISEDVPVLNALALIEVTYEFEAFCASIFQGIRVLDNPAVSINIELTDMAEGQSRLFRVNINADDALWNSDNNGNGASEVNLKKEFWSNANELNSHGVVAYRILESIFPFFAITTDLIPYSNTTEQGSRFIDADKIKSIK